MNVTTSSLSINQLIKDIKNKIETTNLREKMKRCIDYPSRLDKYIVKQEIFDDYKNFDYDFVEMILDDVDIQILDYIYETNIESNSILFEFKKIFKEIITNFFKDINIGPKNNNIINFYGTNINDQNDDSYYNNNLDKSVEDKIKLMWQDIKNYDANITDERNNTIGIQNMIFQQININNQTYNEFTNYMKEIPRFFIPYNRSILTQYDKDTFFNNISGLQYFVSLYKICHQKFYKDDLDLIMRTIPVTVLNLNIIFPNNKIRTYDYRGNDLINLIGRIKLLIKISKRNNVCYILDKFEFKSHIFKLPGVTDKLINQVYLFYLVFYCTEDYRQSFIQIFLSFLFNTTEYFNYTLDDNIRILIYFFKKYKLNESIDKIVNFIC